MQRQSMLLWVTLGITLILQTTTTALAEDKPRVEAFPIIQDDPTHPETPQQILQINVQNYESFPVFCSIIKIYAGIEVGGRMIGKYPVVVTDLRLDAKQELTGRDESLQLRKHLSAYPNWQISGDRLGTLEVECKQEGNVSAAAATPVATQNPAPLPMIEHYQDNGDGTVTDKNTGLMWKRCSEGQTWNGTTCAGDVEKMTWDAAMPNGQQKVWDSYANHDDWQVPTRKDLQSLIYCSSGNPKTWNNTGSMCAGEYLRPTIDVIAFPNTPSIPNLGFWSSSANARGSGHAWIVYFDDGSVGYLNNTAAVRLARKRQ